MSPGRLRPEGHSPRGTAGAQVSEGGLRRHFAGSPSTWPQPGTRLLVGEDMAPAGPVTRKRAWMLVGQSVQSCSPSASLLKPRLQPPPWVLLTTGRGEVLGKVHGGPRRARAGRQPRLPGETGDRTLCGSCLGPAEARRPRGSTRPALQGPSPTVQPGGAPAERGCASKEDFGLPVASPLQLGTRRT